MTPKTHGRTGEWNDGGGYPRKGDDWKDKDGHDKYARNDDGKKDNDYKDAHNQDWKDKDGHDKHARNDDGKKDDDYKDGRNQDWKDKDGHDKHARNDDGKKDDDYKDGRSQDWKDKDGHDKYTRNDDCKKDDDCKDGRSQDWKDKDSGDKYTHNDDCKPGDSPHTGGEPCEFAAQAYDTAGNDADVSDLHGALASMSDVGSVVDFAIDHLDSTGGPLDTSAFDVADAHAHDVS